MYFGIIKSKGNKYTKNIGDYIQALAALQYVPKGHTPVLLDREQLNSIELIKGNKIKVIMNAWFMTNPTHFPPSDAIVPLYVSFHLNPQIEKKFFSDTTIKHLKQYEPIGCRDTSTMEILKSYGIDAYFSGCLTLTLKSNFIDGMKSEYANVPKKNVYIVDPYVDKIIDIDIISSLIQLLRLSKILLFRRTIIKEISNQILKTTFNYTDNKKRFYYAARIYSTYSSLFKDEVFVQGIYKEVRIPVELNSNDEEWLNYARTMLAEYTQAKYVITSRIHCALPCIGLGVPVIFTNSTHMERKIKPTRPRGRLSGLLDFFRKVNIRYGKCFVDPNDFPIKQKIGLDYSFSNKEIYKSYAERLYNFCSDFFR